VVILLIKFLQKTENERKFQKAAIF
jgi:hypothetical protein